MFGLNALVFCHSNGLLLLFDQMKNIETTKIHNLLDDFNSSRITLLLHKPFHYNDDTINRTNNDDDDDLFLFHLFLD